MESTKNFKKQEKIMTRIKKFSNEREHKEKTI